MMLKEYKIFSGVNLKKPYKFHYKKTRNQEITFSVKDLQKFRRVADLPKRVTLNPLNREPPKIKLAKCKNEYHGSARFLPLNVPFLLPASVP